MTLETAQCARCGAPLPVTTAVASVVRQYCGATYTETSNAQPREPRSHSARVPAPVSAPPKPTRSPRVTALAIVVMVIVVIIGGGKAASVLVPSAGMLLDEWYSAPCLVDANGDDVLDVAGRFAAPGSERWRVGVVDGKTGASYIIATWGFGLHAYDPQTGERVWHIGGR